MGTQDRRRQLLVWIVCAFVATASLVTVLVRERWSTTARHVLYLVGDPQRGQALFFGKKQCSICHAIDGHGGRIAPDLSATRPEAPAMGWLATVLWNHAPGMFRRIRRSGPYPELSSQEMADILAFLYQAGTADRPGDAGEGKKVFEEKGCVGCHSVRASGGKSAPDLSETAASGASEWMSAMWNHSQSMVQPIQNALGRWPQFEGAEMNNLVAYVRGTASAQSTGETAGKAEMGWQVFQARCIRCHATRGQGGNLGPQLGPEHALPLSTAQFAGVLWNHAPTMLRLSHENGVPQPTLQKSEMADLVAFLASLRYFEPIGSPYVGERIFRVRGCAKCHGPTAEGTPLGPRILNVGEAFTAVSFTTALWKHGPRMVDRTEALGIPWPKLEANDIGDLVSFLNGLKHK